MKSFLLIAFGFFCILIALPASDSVLVKAPSSSSVYYISGDNRYVFPNDQTYKSWYSDYSTITNVTDEQLASLTLVGNVTYRPGTRLVKIQSDPKVYAVDKGGVLRWVNSAGATLLASDGNTLFAFNPQSQYAMVAIYRLDAKTGNYTEAQMAGVSPSRRARLFRNVGGNWEAKPELQALITWKRHDLLRDPYERPYDLICCRNVVIYFTEAAKTDLYSRFCESLRPNGILFLGATESIPNPRSVGLTPAGLTFYQRR